MSKFGHSFKTFIDINANNTIIKFYLLPLVDVPVGAFGFGSNVNYVLINKTGTDIYVNTKEQKNIRNNGLKEFTNYKYDVTLRQKLFHVFKVPPESLADVQLLLQGNYSKITYENKIKICELAGLPFNRKVNSPFVESSPILQALFTNSFLREVLAEYVDLKVTELPGELISKIPEESKLFIENYVKEESK